MNTAVYLLRAKQMGLSISEMETLEEGMIIDMMIESANDSAEYKPIATQADFDRF